MGFTGVNKFFSLFILQNIYCGYSFDPHRRDGSSNGVPTIYVLCKNKKNKNYSIEFFQFLQLRKNLYITWACFRTDVFKNASLKRRKWLEAWTTPQNEFKIDADNRYCQFSLLND